MNTKNDYFLPRVYGQSWCWIPYHDTFLRCMHFNLNICIFKCNCDYTWILSCWVFASVCDHVLLAFFFFTSMGHLWHIIFIADILYTLWNTNWYYTLHPRTKTLFILYYKIEYLVIKLYHMQVGIQNINCVPMYLTNTRPKQTTINIFEWFPRAIVQRYHPGTFMLVAMQKTPLFLAVH